jgi:hypothetical protein
MGFSQQELQRVEPSAWVRERLHDSPAIHPEIPALRHIKPTMARLTLARKIAALFFASSRS